MPSQSNSSAKSENRKAVSSAKRNGNGQFKQASDHFSSSRQGQGKYFGSKSARGVKEAERHPRVFNASKKGSGYSNKRSDGSFAESFKGGADADTSSTFKGAAKDSKSSTAQRLSERKEGRSADVSRKGRNKPAVRKEITAKRMPQKPGFTSFQLRLVLSILKYALEEKKPLDKAYALYFAKVKIPSVEQGFIIRHINAMFRRLSLLAQVANLKRPSDFERNVERLVLSYYVTQEWPLPELNVEGLDRPGMRKRFVEAQKHPLLNEGCPYWLEELCSKELKEAWPAERKALGEAAPRFIRTNTLKITRDELASHLSAEGVVSKQVKGVNTALEITSNTALFRTEAFKAGYFEQQDAGSQLIAPFLEVEPGMRVVDACAGAGGKTLHLAALMNGKGTLIAMDIEAWKLDDLKKRAKRAGAFNIDTRLIDSTKVIKRLHGEADRVLIDAPCSGLGVLRRTADSKWSDVRPRLIELKQIQADILERYSLMAKVGGKVVYSTCSILPSENHEQIAAFLAKHSDQFELEEEKSIMPSSGFDGFYMARLKRIA